MDFPILRNEIMRVGATASSLAELARTPTFKAAVGILAERCSLQIVETLSSQDMEIYACDDIAQHGVRIPTPFAILCLRWDESDANTDYQSLLVDVMALLRTHDLHINPIVLLCNGPLRHIEEYIRLIEGTFVPLSAADLVRVMLSTPPRTQLIRHVRDRTPLRILNPYSYKGPVPPNMFRGRDELIRRICAQQASYALVGPRAIGKTSLMHRAYERMRQEQQVVVRAEYSPSLSQDQFLNQLITRFVHDHDIHPIVLRRQSVETLELIISDLASGAKRHTSAAGEHKDRVVSVFIDEADELSERCRALTDMFRRCHVEGWARFMFLGYKRLRRAVNDVRQSELYNFVTEMPLTGLPLEECAPLVFEPLVEIGIKLKQPQAIAETIHHDSGGSPSRVQLLCHFLVEELGTRSVRELTPEDAAGAISLPMVRKVLARWFYDSTTPIERWLAALASVLMPCSVDMLTRLACREWPDLSSSTVQAEVHDLITANVLDYRDTNTVDFSFPAMREITRPIGNAKSVMDQLRSEARLAARNQVRPS